MMDRKTIIYVGGFELPDKNGAAQRVVANGKILRELGYNVVFLGVDKLNIGEADFVASRQQHFGFECWSVPYPRTKMEWLESLTQAGPLKRLLTEKYQGDVAAVICYNHPAIAQWKISRLCKQHGAKYIADVTEWYDSSGGGFFFGLIKWADTTLRMRIIHRLADALITTSSIITEFYRRNNMPIVELPTLYDVEAMEVDREDVHSIGKEVRFIYAGSPFNAARLDRKRENIKDRLDAVVILVSKLNASGINVVLSIYGVSQEDYLRAFPEHEKIVKDDSGKIRFLGSRPHREILANLHKSDFSIFFRRKSRVTEAGFPSKLAESISCGTPVITNYLGNLRSYKDRVPGLFLVDFDDMDVCVRATSNVLTDCMPRHSEISAECRSVRPFDFHSYIPVVKSFLDELGIR